MTLQPNPKMVHSVILQDKSYRLFWGKVAGKIRVWILFPGKTWSNAEIMIKWVLSSKTKNIYI